MGRYDDYRCAEAIYFCYSRMIWLACTGAIAIQEGGKGLNRSGGHLEENDEDAWFSCGNER